MGLFAVGFVFIYKIIISSRFKKILWKLGNGKWMDNNDDLSLMINHVC